MPYIKKSDLENMLRSAFGKGYWCALDIDHEEVSLHIKQEDDFQKYFEVLTKNLRYNKMIMQKLAKRANTYATK